MKFIRGLVNLKTLQDGCVLTIGNFDGVHRGHQALLAQLRQEADAYSLPLVVMLFEPQPLEFFRGEQAPARLTRLREKVQHLRDYNVDILLCISFNQRFAAISADAFIQQILCEQLQVKHVVVGEDFRFGHQRQGDYAMLQQAAQQRGFTLTQLDDVCVEDERVSSTQIRQALVNGDFSHAATLLGRAYRMCGRVCMGDQRGREWGIPTANIRLARKVSPLRGVYAVKAHWRGQIVYGVANLGKRPTVDGLTRLLEVHLFDFNQTIYGDWLDVEFIEKIRDEQRFESIDQLKQQIFADIAQAKSVFNIVG